MPITGLGLPELTKQATIVMPTKRKVLEKPRFSLTRQSIDESAR